MIKMDESCYSHPAAVSQSCISLESPAIALACCSSKVVGNSVACGRHRDSPNLQPSCPSRLASLLQQMTATHMADADDNMLCQGTMTAMKGRMMLMALWQERGQSSQKTLELPCPVEA